MKNEVIDEVILMSTFGKRQDKGSKEEKGFSLKNEAAEKTAE